MEYFSFGQDTNVILFFNFFNLFFFYVFICLLLNKMTVEAFDIGDKKSLKLHEGFNNKVIESKSLFFLNKAIM